MIGLTDQQILDKRNFIKDFENTWYYEKLKNFNYDEYIKNCFDLNPRDSLKLYDPEIYYYLDFILKKNPKIIYDVGCGNNFFKKLFADDLKIIGIDPNHKNADYLNFYDNFIKNFGKVDFVFSINSLHFISLTDFKNVLKNFILSVSKGGIGFITFNYRRMIERTETTKLPKLAKKSNIKKELEETVEKEIEEIRTKLINDIDFLLVEITNLFKNEYLNGNIRIIFEIKE